MTEEAPKRFKDEKDWTPDDHRRAVQAEKRGEPTPQIETDEYREARREHLRAGGFDVDDEQDPALADLPDADDPNPLEIPSGFDEAA